MLTTLPSKRKRLDLWITAHDDGSLPKRASKSVRLWNLIELNSGFGGRHEVLWAQS